MNRGLLLLLLFLFCLGSVVLGLFSGGMPIPFEEVIAALLHPAGEGTTHTLIWDLRLPRIFMAGVVGASLATCGVVFQAILRNPLAEPYTLGVSGGGALGATIAILFGIGGLAMTLICFAGCCLSIGVVLGAAHMKNFTNSMLILSGIIMSFIFSSAVMFVFTVASSREVHASILWLMGSLSAPPDGSTGMLLGIVPVMAGLIFFAKDLNLLSLGDETSYHLGLNAKKAKVLLLLSASLITGVCVALSGVIAFVGLVIPHFTRRLFSADHFFLLPSSMLAGAGFLILSDSLSQILIRPMELPVGVITGMVGGIFFVLYLIKARPEEVI